MLLLNRISWSLLLVGILLGGCKKEQVDFAAKARQAEAAGDRVAALQNYELAIRVQPGDLALREKLIELLLLESRDEQALPHLMLLVRQRRDDAPLLVRTVKLMLEFGGWKESKEFYEAAPLTVQKQPAVQVIQAELLIREAKFEEANQILLKVIEDAQTSLEIVRSAKLRRGRLLHQMGRSPAALEEFNSLIELDPKDTEAMQLRANLYLAGHQYTEARAAYEAVLAVDPKAQEALLGLASLAVQEQRIEDAIQSYEKALALYPKDSDVLFWLAELHFQRGDMAALEALKPKAVGRQWEKELILGYLSGLQQMGAGDYAGALKELERLQPVLTGYPGLFDKIGLCYLKLGNPTQAEAAFSKLPHDTGVQDQVWGALGQSYLSVTNYPRAVHWLEISRGSNRLVPLAQAQFGIGDLNSAYKNALLSIKEDPTSISALLIAAEAARRLDEHAPGNTYFEKIAEISPDSAAGIYARAQLLVGSNQLAEAATLLEQQKDIVGTQAGPILLLAEMKLRLGQNDEARKYLQDALRLDPRYARAHAFSGILAQTTGDLPAADKHFTAALAVDSTDRVALMGKGLLAYRQEDYRVASDLFDRASNLKRPEAEAALFWALSEFAKADMKRALLAAERAVRLNPTNAFAKYLEVRGNLANRDWNRASQIATELNLRQPDYAPGYHALALLSLRTNGVNQALRLVQQGLQVQSTNLLLQPLEIELLRLTSQTNTAWQRLDKMKQTFPQQPDRYLAEVNLLFDRKDYLAARSVVLQGLTANPRDTRLQQQLLDSFVRQGQEKEAAPVMETALNNDPDNLALRFTCARLREIREEWSAAEALYRAVLQGEPKNIATLNNLSLIVARDEKRLDEAVKLAQRAYVLDGKNPAVADTLAMLVLAAGDARQAVILLETARQQAPKSIAIRLHLVEALLERGLAGEARKEFETLAKDFPAAHKDGRYQTLSVKLTAGTGAAPGKAN